MRGIGLELRAFALAVFGNSRSFEDVSKIDDWIDIEIETREYEREEHGTCLCSSNGGSSSGLKTILSFREQLITELKDTSLIVFSFLEWDGDGSHLHSSPCMTEDEMTNERERWRSLQSTDAALKLFTYHVLCGGGGDEGKRLTLLWLRRAAMGGEWERLFKLAAWLDELGDLDDKAEALLILGKMRPISNEIQRASIDQLEMSIRKNMKK